MDDMHNGDATSSLPPGHPSIPPGRTGVLLANLGTPDGHDYWSMRRYLGQFLSDRRVIDYPAWKWQPLLQLVILTKRPFTSGRAYRRIWNTSRNESPLLTMTREQSEGVAARLESIFGDRIMTGFCMRYGNPAVRPQLEEMLEQGCRRILFFPLYPQYSATTTASATDELCRSMQHVKWQPALRTVPPYFDRPAYIEALAQSVTDALGPDEDTVLVVSFHGVPERFLAEGDPYYCHCRKTSRLLRERLGWPEDQLVTSFQSQFGKEKWHGPATVVEVARLAREGRKRIAVIAPGFAADCIETIDEIDVEIREEFERAGGEEFIYVPCLNASPGHLEMLADIITESLAGWH